jgi:hypothetical protein
MLLFCASGAALSRLPLKGTKIGFCDFVRNVLPEQEYRNYFFALLLGQE